VVDLARKPMARAVRVPLIEREVRERLSAAAVAILIDRAELLAEGRRATSPTAGKAFFGTTMLTLALDRLTDVVQEPPTAETATRLAALMRADARVQRRLRKIAEREARRMAGGEVRVRAEIKVRAEGAQVFVDVEMEERGG
jgi:hypothetical protein